MTKDDDELADLSSTPIEEEELLDLLEWSEKRNLEPLEKLEDYEAEQDKLLDGLLNMDNLPAYDPAETDELLSLLNSSDDLTELLSLTDSFDDEGETKAENPEPGQSAR